MPKFLHNIDMNGNEIQNLSLEKTTSPSTDEGTIYYNTSDDTVRYYKAGGAEVTLGSATGDISSVVAGAGMTGGATTGDATLNVIAGDGITVNADDVAITAAQTTITSVYNASLKLGRDADNLVDFATTDNKIIFRANGANQIRLEDGALVPVTDNDIDLGTSSLEFKNAYFAGTVTSDAFAGPLTGDVTGNADTATTLETARNIGGVSFNGGANIDLPGVNATGNQDTSGNAATATALATARAINGVDFDGTGAITITAAGSTLSDTVTVAKGGTGQTSLNSNGVLVGNGTSGITSSTNLSFDDTDLTLASTGKMEFRDSNSYIHSNAVNDIEVVATTITLDAGSDIQLEGNTTVTGNFTVSGTLSVEGTTTTVDSTTVAIADSMLKLAKDQGTSSDDVDFGFYGQYGVGGTAKYAGIFRDQSVSGDPFVFFDSLQAEPGATVNTGGTGYDLADISAGAITAADGFTGDVTGDLTGTVATATQGTINHDSLANFVANEHIDHSSVSISSGNGLTGGGTIASTRTLTVGAGDGITVNTNDVAVTAAQTTITSVFNSSLKVGYGDSHANIDFSTDDAIIFDIDGTQQIKLQDGALVPITDNDIDLGTSSVEFKNAYFDGTVTSDAFAGPLTGNVTGNASGSSGSCTGNAATATALESSRNIGGVAFDGTGNINLPGVNTSGNQDTSGNAATATVLATGAVGGVKVFELTHVGSGSGQVAGNSGSASSDSHTWTITHGMGAGRFYKVEVLLDSGNYDTVFADVTRPSDTTIVITMASAVANGAYRAMVQRMA